MRIIAGRCRRLGLEVADESTTRPFLEMARGALFNSLGDRIIDASVLDLYAGSGALGLEALSRGAAACLFVERDRNAFAALGRNIATCGMEQAATAVRQDVGQALSGLDRTFGIIFVDPPFPDLGEWNAGGKAAGIMADIARVLGQDGEMVFRLEDGKVTPPDWPGLRLDTERRYGRSRVCRYRHEG